MSDVRMAALRRQLMVRITDVLAPLPVLADERRGRKAMTLLATEIGKELPEHEFPLDRPDVALLADFCGRAVGGLDALVYSLRMADADPNSELLRLVDEWKALDRFQDSDWELLRMILADLDAEGLGPMMRAATSGREHIVQAHCTSAHALFCALADFNVRPDGVPPSLVLLGLIADQLADTHAANAQLLRKWRQERMTEFAVNEPADEGARCKRANIDLRMCSLVIMLEPDGPDDSRYRLTAWHNSDPRWWAPERQEPAPVDYDHLESEVSEQVRKAEQRLAETDHDIALEFVLPWRLLNEPIHRWVRDPNAKSITPLGTMYPVVVRSLERMRAHHWHRPWRRRWRQVVDNTAQAKPMWCQPDGDGYLAQLEADLRIEEHVVALGLSEPPDLAGSLGRGELVAALHAGIPIAVWRAKGRASQDFRDIVNRIFTNQGLANVLVNTRQWRCDSVRPNSPCSDKQEDFHDLIILWDDPDRLPEVSGSPGGFRGGRS